MKRVGSIKEVIDVTLELPAGAAPYEEFDFEPYCEEARNEEDLRKTWRVFTKVKDVLDNGRRLENASWRLWFKERRKPAIFSLADTPVMPVLQHAPPPTIADVANVARQKPHNPKINVLPSDPPPAADPPLADVTLNGNATPLDGSLSSLERYDRTLDANLRRAEEETERIVGDMFGGVDQRFQKETDRIMERDKAERMRALLELADRHELPDGVLDDILTWVSSFVLNSSTPSPPSNMTPAAMYPLDPVASLPIPSSRIDPSKDVAPVPDDEKAETLTAFLPPTAAEGRAFVQAVSYTPRPRVGAFCHSLERNGANNFLLYLVRELRDDMTFDVVSPKDGTMRADYEAIGVRVVICSVKSPQYHAEIRRVINTFQYAIANTIMTTEVVNAAAELSVPCLWVIHEAWPRDQFDYYAKEVFMTPHVDHRSITNGFDNATRIVFPAKVQRRCYEGLVDGRKCRVIYNGIPLASINAFRMVQSRELVRRELGYGKDDMVIVHMGTVCRRKAQLVTCQAFAELVAAGRDLKLLLVGARYVRPHEVQYIEECRQTLEATGADHVARIVDVKKNVLPYYLAADIVLCPSINEVLPLVICEAMAFERPVIASRIDGIPEAITHGVEGLLVEAGNVAELYDAIEKLADDADLRARMGTAGRKRVLSQFSFATMSKTYRETIGETLDMDDANGDNAVTAAALPPPTRGAGGGGDR